MENSYCGMRCIQCTYKTAGKCIGCKPEIENTYLKELSEKAGQHELTAGNTYPEDTSKRYSTYCQIAICCRKNKYESCGECNKRPSCYDYSCKGRMSSIIEARLNEWGVTTHGLKESIYTQILLLFCFVLLIIPDIASSISSKIIFTLLYLPITAVTVFGYSKMVKYSEIFRVTVLFTCGDMLIRFLRDIIDYGTLVNMVLSILGLAISVLNYKITFDAYADMVSDVDDRLEKQWLHIFPITVTLYVIACIAVLFTQSTVALMLPSVIMDIIIIAYMIRTIEVCKRN